MNSATVILRMWITSMQLFSVIDRWIISIMTTRSSSQSSIFSFISIIGGAQKILRAKDGVNHVRTFHVWEVSRTIYGLSWRVSESVLGSTFQPPSGLALWDASWKTFIVKAPVFRCAHLFCSAISDSSKSKAEQAFLDPSSIILDWKFQPFQRFECSLASFRSFTPQLDRSIL